MTSKQQEQTCCISCTWTGWTIGWSNVKIVCTKEFLKYPRIANELHAKTVHAKDRERREEREREMGGVVISHWMWIANVTRSTRLCLRVCERNISCSERHLHADAAYTPKSVLLQFISVYFFISINLISIHFPFIHKEKKENKTIIMFGLNSILGILKFIHVWNILAAEIRQRNRNQCIRTKSPLLS